MLSFGNSNNILNNNSFGFRKNKSITLATYIVQSNIIYQYI